MTLLHRYTPSMSSKQNIERPHGVSVFGSHVLRVKPDLAVVSLAINRLAAEPAEAFDGTREAAANVRAALQKLKVPDEVVRSSQVTLSTQYRRSGSQSEFVGHRATVRVTISLTDLSLLESVLVGSVGAGADQVSSVQFKSLKLRELRASARREAVAAARQKAELYADAAGVKLGKALHIEDADPKMVGRRDYGHVIDEAPTESDESAVGVYDPGTIPVTGAVLISYAIL